MTSLVLLGLAASALLLGPLVRGLGLYIRAVEDLFDGFALAFVTGACCLLILPYLVDEIGLAGLLFVVLGILLPMSAQRVGITTLWPLSLIHI